MTAILRDAATGTWRLFDQPREIIVERLTHEVIPALHRIEAETRNGAYAAGFIAYEAAPAFDPALLVQPDETFPLLWFGLYDSFRDLPADFIETPERDAVLPEGWTPSIDRKRYAEVFRQLQELIRSGETYQVNFTYRLTTAMSSSAWELFRHLAAAQPTAYGAYLEAGEWAVCCASPELFFEKNGRCIRSKPMKGTAPRGLWFDQDVEFARVLRSSEKERSENVMIVDMVRNDLGRIAEPGTVQVTSLFETERYPTVWQMTSTVAAETDAPIAEIFAAMFPPASITGAPKARTMSIIAGVEASPRRIYTGTIGFLDPDGRAQFNVAIRTALVNREAARVEYGIGGGIVADSISQQEMAEAELKSRVLGRPTPSFDLLETMLWCPESGYRLLDRHLQRLMESAAYFGFPVDLRQVAERLQLYAEATLRPSRSRWRVRLIVDRRAAIHLSARAIGPDDGFGAVVLAAEPVDSGDRFLYHKTTNRATYERARRLRPEASDVLLFNERREVTESTIANFIAQLDDTLVTPPVRCGLLAGTARAELLAGGQIQERVVRLDDLQRASKLYLINSVRGMQEISIARLETFPAAPSL